MFVKTCLVKGIPHLILIHITKMPHFDGVRMFFEFVLSTRWAGHISFWHFAVFLPCCLAVRTGFAVVHNTIYDVGSHISGDYV